MKAEDLPGYIRVRLAEKDRKELWNRIEKEGIKSFSREIGQPASKLYNWKNRDSLIPIKVPIKVLDSFEIRAFKGKGRSKPVKDPKFPLKIDDELYTRTEASVSVNREGTPLYIAQELSLVERFQKLLQRLGDVPVSLYSREQYELRFPSYLNDLIRSSDNRKQFNALFDEKGRFEDDRMAVEGREMKIEEFDGELHSQEKKLELALKTGAEETVKQLITEASRRAGSAVK